MKKINLSKIGTFTSEDGAEIVAHDPTTQRLFVTTGDTVEIIDISDPANPTKVSDIDVTSVGGGANSVAVKNGIVAVAVEAQTKQDPGVVAFYDIDGTFQNSVTVGALPDMLTFNPDGTKILVANEGEPNDDYTVDPEGSIGIIDISGGVGSAIVTTASFNGFDDQKQALINRGVRIFGPDASVSQDLEPEYIAVSADGTTAFVTLQENNAVAVVDIANATVQDVLPLGVKDHSKGQPTVTNYEVQGLGPITNGDAPLTTPSGQTIDLGGLSGLYYAGEEGDKIKFVSVPDRGPNPDTFKEDKNNDGKDDTVRPLALPDYQARIVEIELDTSTGVASVSDEIFLTRDDNGTSVPITGAPNFVFDVDGNQVDEFPVDAQGNDVALDPVGGDMEGIVIDPEGNYWTVDEYRPAIYQFDSEGVLLNRYVSEGTAASAGEPEGTYGTETLPAEYANRRRNRGFEAVALDTDENILYAFIQTPLANPNRDTSDASDVIRILGINPGTGEPVSEHVYLLEDPAVRSGGRVDKIGDAVYVGDGKFQVIERDSVVGADAKKFIFEIDLKGATNVLGVDFPEETLEQQTAEDLATAGITPVNKIKVTNLPSIGYVAGDKPEGLASLPDGRLAVINDNDFGLLDETIPGDGSVVLNPEPTETVLGLIEFSEGNKLDASNEDGGINIQNFPVFGLYQPDAIDSFTVDGKTYYITANEGDARIRPDGDIEDEQGNVLVEEGDIFNEEQRIGKATLDPEVFPNAQELQKDENLGRLKITNTQGDLDGDGDFDKLFSYGARSFSIWDDQGNLVFDSGDQIAQITAEQTPELFNANDGITEEFDQRSDDKGAEPESVTVGIVNGKPYGFIGLERAGGGVLVYELSNPTAPEFVQYIRTGGDIAPEGLKFIPASESPNGNPVLAVANEESKTTTLYNIADPGSSSENPVITEDVNGTTIEAIDLTGFTNDKVTADFTISREAGFDNQVYFYAVDDITGTVDGLAPDADGYLEAALNPNNLVSPAFSTTNNNEEIGTVEFDAGSIVVPAIVANGTLSQALSGDAEVYFPYLDANSNNGNFDHIKLLDNNTFAFEDLPNGGDRDFDDITIKLDNFRV